MNKKIVLILLSLLSYSLAQCQDKEYIFIPPSSCCSFEYGTLDFTQEGIDLYFCKGESEIDPFIGVKRGNIILDYIYHHSRFERSKFILMLNDPNREHKENECYNSSGIQIIPKCY